jgi:hypothetical protein
MPTVASNFIKELTSSLERQTKERQQLFEPYDGLFEINPPVDQYDRGGKARQMYDWK